MVSRASRESIRAWTRLGLSPLRAISRALRMFLYALAGALGAPRPKLLRHEDAVTQVAEEEAIEE